MSTRRPRIKAVTSLTSRRKVIQKVTNQHISQNPDTVVEYPRKETIPSPLQVHNVTNNVDLLNTLDKESFETSSEFAVADKNTEKKAPQSLKILQNILVKPAKQSTSGNVENAGNKVASVRAYTPKKNSVRNIKDYILPLMPRNLRSYPKTTASELILRAPVNPNQLPKSDNTGCNSNMPPTKTNNTDVHEDLCLPSKAESAKEDYLIDGIDPLSPCYNTPESKILLKHDIESENAQICFDRIVPLPASTNIQPVPHLENNVQESISESEDIESSDNDNSGQSILNDRISRHKRHRNNSQASCSSAKSSDHNDRSQTEHQQTVRRRRRYSSPFTPKTMYDLIYFNPTNKPIDPNLDPAAEDVVFNIKEEDPLKDSNPPIPQVKMDAAGNIIIDPDSLVNNGTHGHNTSSSVVASQDENDSDTNMEETTRRNRCVRWTKVETARFFRALCVVGTDFSLMTELFPDRTRKNLKNKFKKEDKDNADQIDKALDNNSLHDINYLKQKFKSEREQEVQAVRLKAEMLKYRREQERDRVKMCKIAGVRRSKAAIALETCVDPSLVGKWRRDVTLDDFIEKALKAKKRQKRVKESTENYILPNEIPESSLKETVTLTADSSIITDSSITEKSSIIADSSAIPDSSIIADSSITANETVVPTNYNNNPTIVTSTIKVSQNIEAGCIVVSTINNADHIKGKIFQTFLALGNGHLTPIMLPLDVLINIYEIINSNQTKDIPTIISSQKFGSFNSAGSQQVNPTPNLNADYGRDSFEWPKVQVNSTPHNNITYVVLNPKILNVQQLNCTVTQFK